MLAIIGGKIITMSNKGVIDEGLILIDKGKIKKVTEKVEIPDQAQTLEFPDKYIMPGIIDGHTHLGIGEDAVGWEGKDYNETTDPITPHLRAIDAINPADDGLKEAYQHGITTVMTGPGSANVIGGESAVIKTKGKTVEEMLLKETAGIKAAFGENPKRVYNDQNKTPATRMAIAALLRKTLMEVEDYLDKKNKSEKEDEPFQRDIKKESLTRVLRKDIPLKTHAHRADDIITILRIAREFDIDITLEHCTEGHKIAEKIADTGFPAIIGPTLTGKVKVELKERDFKTPAVLSEAGVKVALMSDHPVLPSANLPVYAALAVKAGMNREEALKSITINSAEILGVDNEVGSLEPDKDADLVVFDKDPLDIQSNIEKVIIEGDIIEE